MKLSKAINYIEKTDSYKFQVESQLAMQRCGIIKRMSDAGIALSSLGSYFFDYYCDTLSGYFEKSGYKKLKTDDPEAFISPAIKSFKHLEQGAYSDAVVNNENYFSLNGLISPPKLTRFKSVYYTESMENARDKARKAVIDLIDTFNLEDDYFKIIEGENGFKLVYEMKEGEQKFYRCDTCNMNMLHVKPANPDKIKKYEGKEFDPESPVLSRVYTPDSKTVEQVASYIGCKPENIAKTIVVEVMGGFFAALVRGDRELSIDKLSRIIGRHKSLINLADKDKFASIYDIEAGFIGPVGLPSDIKIIADVDIDTRTPFVVGGNIKDYHFENCILQRDFKPTRVADISIDEAVDRYECHRCKSTDNKVSKGVLTASFEYGKADGVETRCKTSYLNESGKEKKAHFIISCINVEPLIGCIYDYRYSQKNGIYEKKSAPFNVSLIITNEKDEIQKNRADRLYEDLTELGFRVVYNDSQQRAGTKFALDDALGTPVRITAGKKAVDGVVEIKDKREDTVKEVKIDFVPEELK